MPLSCTLQRKAPLRTEGHNSYIKIIRVKNKSQDTFSAKKNTTYLTDYRHQINIYYNENEYQLITFQESPACMTSPSN